MTSSEPNITLFTGRFGSGKTEIALNYALQLADLGLEPLLVDLDIVTPYFRTRDKIAEMAQRGVEVVSPFEVGRYVDLPAISPYILGALEQTRRPALLDVGGDVQGARALSQYAPTIIRRGYAMHFVVNPYRPFMDTAEGVLTAVREIEQSARLRVSTLVSNPNMMSESTPDLFWQGHRHVLVCAEALGVPVSLVAVGEKLAHAVDRQALDVPLLVIHRFFLMFDAK
ncbi:MAG: hypothetical protein JW934_07300 [Anaerolineae bacterium]|nr:hypothetical protein [Anaerolineae bacterium]